MATTRADLEGALAVHDAKALRLILDAAEVQARGATTSAELATRIADAIWWNYSTPLGYVTERASFEDVVRHLGAKLKVGHALDESGSVWDQSEQLTLALLATLPTDGVRLEDLDSDTQSRLRPSWIPAIGMGSGATGSLMARWSASKLLTLLKSPIGRLLPLIPYLGPWVGVVRTGASAVHMVAGPLGVGLAVMSLNASLGSNYRRLVPLVLGVGALRPQAVDDAFVVHDDALDADSDDEAEPDAVQDEADDSADEADDDSAFVADDGAEEE